MGKFVEVKVFSTRLEVELAQGLLEGNDIDSRTLPDEDDASASTRDGFRLLVPEEYAEEARELLTEFDVDLADSDEDDDEFVHSGEGDKLFDDDDEDNLD